jgi:hypothetical protein
VNDNRNTVARESNVKLNPVSPNRERLTKRRHRIFRRNSRRPTMPNNQHQLVHKKAQKTHIENVM